MNQIRSLNLEHVSPGLLVQQEISRRTSLGQQAEQAFKRGLAASDQLQIALLRKWFWARKPDAGFLLEGFPATLLQALVFDEWLEARGETLTAALTPDQSSTDPVATHYRTQGLLTEVLHASAA
ncbi:nucleoside monophosphate kinase [Oleiharenicola lentus]|uniref:nucleoside monophosphate kinase n=1 Tax=Oleiharenicola lentus TaxID=2508720 RepID=UPI003F67ACCC